MLVGPVRRGTKRSARRWHAAGARTTAHPRVGARNQRIREDVSLLKKPWPSSPGNRSDPEDDRAVEEEGRYRSAVPAFRRESIRILCRPVVAFKRQGSASSQRLCAPTSRPVGATTAAAG